MMAIKYMENQYLAGKSLPQLAANKYYTGKGFNKEFELIL
jgi:hypothetical protein